MIDIRQIVARAVKLGRDQDLTDESIADAVLAAIRESHVIVERPVWLAEVRIEVAEAFTQDSLQNLVDKVRAAALEEAAKWLRARAAASNIGERDGALIENEMDEAADDMLSALKGEPARG